jgi:hypothetical protein
MYIYLQHLSWAAYVGRPAGMALVLASMRSHITTHPLDFALLDPLAALSRLCLVSMATNGEGSIELVLTPAAAVTITLTVLAHVPAHLITTAPSGMDHCLIARWQERYPASVTITHSDQSQEAVCAG